MGKPTFSFGTGYIVRQDIKAFAVRKGTRDDKEVQYLNFSIERLKSVDKNGNTHCITIQEYDSEKKERVGEKEYIGKFKIIPTKYDTDDDGFPSDPDTVAAKPTEVGNNDDLPF